MAKKAKTKKADAVEDEVVAAPADTEAVEPEVASVADDAVGEDADLQETDADDAGEPAVVKTGILSVMRRKAVWIPTLAVVLLAIVGVGGYVAYQRDQQRKADEAKAAAARKAEAALVKRFDAVMDVRDLVLAAEAKINSARVESRAAAAPYATRLATRNKTVRTLTADYKKAYAEVEAWNNNMSLPGIKPYPSKPRLPDPVPSPDFKAQAAALKDADTALRAAVAKLTLLESDKDFGGIVAQLREGSRALSDEALHNADVLATCVEPAKASDAAGCVDTKLFSTLREGSSKAMMTAVNDQAVRFVKLHHLDARLYDIAGGRDVSPSDSSTLTASGK